MTDTIASTTLNINQARNIIYAFGSSDVDKAINTLICGLDDEKSDEIQMFKAELWLTRFHVYPHQFLSKGENILRPLVKAGNQKAIYMMTRLEAGFYALQGGSNSFSTQYFYKQLNDEMKNNFSDYEKSKLENLFQDIETWHNDKQGLMTRTREYMDEDFEDFLKMKKESEY